MCPKSYGKESEVEKAFLIGACACALLGAIRDVKTRRIPNWLTYSAFLAGLLLRACFGGWHGVWYGFLGGLVGGGIFLLFFLVGGMGAGDVKLMAAVGSLAGWDHIGNSPAVVIIVLACAIAGGVLALIYMVFRRRVGSTLKNVWFLVRHHMLFGVQSHPDINLHDPNAIKMPYALAIAAGTFYSLGAMLVQR